MISEARALELMHPRNKYFGSNDLSIKEVSKVKV